MLKSTVSDRIEIDRDRGRCRQRVVQNQEAKTSYCRGCDAMIIKLQKLKC